MIPPEVGAISDMAGVRARFELHLLGSFRLLTPLGERVELSSRKGMALIAMLAMADDGEHARAWLQEKLWGSRQQIQGRASLRRELSNLRRRLNRWGLPLLITDHEGARLDLGQIWVDAREASGGGAVEFLEGFDVAGENGFEEWLREQRAALRQRYRSVEPGKSGPTNAAGDGQLAPLPSRIVDVSQPAPGFAGRPALAVLPFVNATGEAGNDYLSEGIGEDLIDRLSKLRWLPVIARSSSFSYGADEEGGKAVGAILGAKYLLTGRVRKSPDGCAITVGLTEAASGHVHLSRRLVLPAPYSQDALEQLVADLVGIFSTPASTASSRRGRTAGRKAI